MKICVFSFCCVALLSTTASRLLAQQTPAVPQPSAVQNTTSTETHPQSTWSWLPSLPDPIGVAGPFAGTSGGVLIVGGGANFPTGPHYDGHPKVWHDQVFVLAEPDGKWKPGPKLPQPTAYGVSLSWHDDRNDQDVVICLGGGDKNQHFNRVFKMFWSGSTLEFVDLPPMPKPVAFFAGALLGDTIYVAGGIESPTSKVALKEFWSLDLSQTDLAWKVLPVWEGKERMLPVMAALDGKVFLLSGAKLLLDDSGNVTREFLRDTHAFDPTQQSWKRLADMPRSVVAAPTPAMIASSTKLAVLAGDDGEHFSHAGKLKDRHPGFKPTLFIYDSKTDRWSFEDLFPKIVPLQVGPHRNRGQWPPVTTTTVRWKNRWVIPSGEIKPGVRTPRIAGVEFEID